MSERERPLCPICGKPSTEAHRPFCSTRCTSVDLQRWLSDRYVVPGEPDLDGPDAEPSDLPGHRDEG